MIEPVDPGVPTAHFRMTNATLVVHGRQRHCALYVPLPGSYIKTMTSVLTVREQAETSEAARKVGGYAELMRLQDERRAIKRRGKVAKLVREPQTGRFKYIAVA